MTKPRKLFRPSFYRIFCLLVTTVFLFGLLPVPVLAQGDTTPPADVTDLAVGNPTPGSLTLTWTAPGNDGDNGTASQYDIRYHTSIISDNTSWTNATQASSPPTPSIAGSSENFTVGNLDPETTYYFALKTADETPNWSSLSNSPSGTTTAQPYFNIAHSEGRFSFMLEAGDNITESFNISSVNNFEGPIALVFYGPHEVENNSNFLDTSSLSTNVTLAAGDTASVTLILGTSAQMPSGTYQCSIEGQTAAYGGQQKGVFFTVIVGVAGQPLLSASPSVVSASSNTTFFASQFTSGEAVTLSWDSGPKVGTAEEELATGQIAGDKTWNAQVTIPADMPGGNFEVRASSASNTAVCTLTVTSGAGEDFIISSSPQFISIDPDSSGSVTVYITSINNFSAPVNLSVSSLPGIAYSLAPSSVTPPSGETTSATLTITVQDWVTSDMYHIMVEGECTDPLISKSVDITLDVPSPAGWGPSIALSQTYGMAGDAITITGSNFPAQCQGETVVIREVFTDTPLVTTPATISVDSGGFTGTFTIPSGLSSGNYRIEARVSTTGDFAEKDFQVLGAGTTFTLEITPQSVTVATEEDENSASVSVNLFSTAGGSSSVNLAVEGAPSWLEYQFAGVSVNTPASGSDNISVPAGGSASKSLTLTADLMAPTGTYSITVKAWKTGQTAQSVSLELNVQPPAGFDMCQLTLSPAYGGTGKKVTFSGSGFTGCTPGEVKELTFGPVDILTSLPPITVPQSGDSAGKFSGNFQVPVLDPGTYYVNIRVGTSPDKFFTKLFTISDATDSFVLQLSPAFIWVEQGSQVNTSIKVQAVSSSPSLVKLAVEGVPADISASFTSDNLTPPPGGVANTELTINSSNWTPTGHYTMTVRGWVDTNENEVVDGGEEVDRANLELDVVPPAGFDMASLYISPTFGAPGSWITITGTGFPPSTQMEHLYIGSPTSENDVASQLPTITTDSSGQFSAVLQLPSTVPSGMYPVEVVVGIPPADMKATSDFSVVSEQAIFNISLSPTMIHAAPDSIESTSLNIQSVGSSSANITIQVPDVPPDIRWRFDQGTWDSPTTVTPPIGGTVVSTLEVRAEPWVPMGHYSLIVEAFVGEERQNLNLELEVGAAGDYDMPIFSVTPSSDTVGTSVSFSGSNFPADTQVSRITFGGDNISLAQAITTSPQGSFSGKFTVPSTVRGQPTLPGSYIVNVIVGSVQAGTQFDVYGSDATFNINLSPNYLQGEPGGYPETSGVLKALGSSAPTVKMTVKGLPPGVITKWDGQALTVFTLNTPPGGQNNFGLGLELPYMIAMGQYPAILEGWVDSVVQNDVWDDGEEVVRVNLELAIMPPQDYGMGMLSLSPTFGQVGDTITFAGSGFSGNTTVASLTFAGTDVLTQSITTSAAGSFSGVFTVPSTAFAVATGPGMYPVDVTVGTPPHDRSGHFEFDVVASDQNFSVSASPGWLVRSAGETAYVNIAVRSLVASPPSPTVFVQIDGLPRGVTSSFTSCNVTPPVGDMESRELVLTILDSCPVGNYPISIKAYNVASPTDEMRGGFTLEVTPSSSFAEMGMAMVTISPTFGSVGDTITVNGYGFPNNQSLTSIYFGAENVTPTVAITTDEYGDFSAVVTVPDLSAGSYSVQAMVQNVSRHAEFIIMATDATFSLQVSPQWLEPIPAGDAMGRAIAITVNAMPGKTPTVTLSIEGLFTPMGTITEVWEPASSVNVTMSGGMAGAKLILKPSIDTPPGAYPFLIVGQDTAQNRWEVAMELMVASPSDFMDSQMGMTGEDWNQQWQGTEWEYGIYFPEVSLSPNIGAADTPVNYSGTNLLANAVITSITFAGNTVPLPSGNLTADSEGGFSGSFIINDAWQLASGTYSVVFHAEKDSWSQYIMTDFRLTTSGDKFIIELKPDWLPPIPPGGSESTMVYVKSLGAGATVAFSIESLPSGVNYSFSSENVTVSSGGTASVTLTLTPTTDIQSGHYFADVKGEDSDSNVFYAHLEFEVQLPTTFMDKTWMQVQGVWFPEITLNPTMGPPGTQVTVRGTDFPAEATVTYLRFAGMNLPVPSGTVANENGDFILVFNVPTTMWGGATPSGCYDVEVEAQGQQPVFIMKPFQVTGADVAFTLRANPDWLPPIPPNSTGSTTILVDSIRAAANVTLAIDMIPPGVDVAFSPSNQVSVSPGGSSSVTLTLTPTYILPGYYHAEIKGTANGNEFWAPLDFEVQPPNDFMTWDKDAMMTQMGMDVDDMYFFYFPEITLNPNIGQAGTQVTVRGIAFPAGANVTYFRFAGTNLPIPTGTAADNNGDFTLVFNVPTTMWGGATPSGCYDVEVEAQKLGTGEPPVFIMKPFQVAGSDVAFTIKANPDWLPPIPPNSTGNTTILVDSIRAAANVTLAIDMIPPGIDVAFSPSNQVSVSPGGSSSVTLTLTPTYILPGYYHAEIKGTANGNEFWAPLDFEVQPPNDFMTWDKDAMMTQMGMDVNDMYFFYFPEITFNPTAGQAGTKVTVRGTDFPAGANVTHLRFAGTNLPIPTGTAADSNGAFTLVFNVPTTMWGDTTPSGCYDVEVEAQKLGTGEPPVFIMKPFQVAGTDVAFTIKANPDWLPPIPPNSTGNTTILVDSIRAAANVTLAIDMIPPGVDVAFSPSNQVSVSPRGSSSVTLTLTPTYIPPGHYHAEIKGTANGNEFWAPLDFEVQPSAGFMDQTWMQAQGVWFPEITFNPTAGQAGTKVTVRGTDFPAGANVTHLRFAGTNLPIPTGTAADSNGAFTLVFNVPSGLGVGTYMIEVEVEKTGIPPVFIAKPFSLKGAGVSFNLNVVPGFIPGVPQGESGNTTIFVESTGQGVTVELYVDGLPPGVVGTFDSDNLSVSPGLSVSTKLTITTKASTPPGHYPLTIRGVSGSEVRVVPFGFGVMPPAIFQIPEFRLEPNFAPAGYGDKQFKVTFSGSGFPPSQNIVGIDFGSQPVAIPENLTTDTNGSFNGVFLMPTGLDSGIYDVRITVATGDGTYMYDSRPFAIKAGDTTFILQPSPPYLPPIVQGGQGTTTVNVRAVGTSSANVTLYIDGLTPGITAGFSPSNVVTASPGSSSSATVTLNVGSATPSGPYSLSIRGVSNNETVVVPLGFGVMPNIGEGEGHATITVNPPNGRPGEHIGISGAGFTAGATITLTAGPPGAVTPVDITPGTIQVQPDGTWATQITVPAVAEAPPGSYIVKATDGTSVAKCPFYVVPVGSADFFLDVSPPFLEIVQGQNSETTFRISSKNEFKEAVRFSVGDLPPGVIATFTDATGNIVGKFSGTSGGITEVIPPTALIPRPGEDLMVTILIEADSATPTGPYDIALQAATGTIFRAIPLGLLVSSPGASMVTSPMSGPADTDISLSGSGFTAGETVTVTFAGTSISTVPATITVAGDGTFTAVITAPSIAAGIHPVRATGATSGVSIDRPFSLKPSAVNTFVLYASPLQVNIPKAGSGSVTVKIEPSGSFQSPVTFSVSGLDAITGATHAFSPASTVTPSVGTPTSATLTINIPAGATEGTYKLTVLAVGGGIMQTRGVNVKVVPPANTPDFSINVAPDTVSLNANSTSEAIVTVTSLNGFTGAVNLIVTMSDSGAVWPSEISYNADNVTPSATTGLGKQAVTFTASSGAQPGNWAFKITGTSGALEHSTEVMLICTPAGTTTTTHSSFYVDPTTITDSTPMDMEAPWGDTFSINNFIGDGSEAATITPSSMEVTPDTLAPLPTGTLDALDRVTNVESSVPVADVGWDIGLKYDPAVLAAAGIAEESLKIAYLNPETGVWTEVDTTVDTANDIAYAPLSHFSSWTVTGTPTPPSPRGGGGGGSVAPSLITIEGSGLSNVNNLSLDRNGIVKEDCLAKTLDGKASLDIPKGIKLLDSQGKVLDSLSASKVTSPPASPSQTEIAVVSAYDFGPDGATFEPAITLYMSYDLEALPEGMMPDELYIAYWDGSQWQSLESTVYTKAGVVKAEISHFTQFAVIGKVVPPAPEPELAPASFAISTLSVTPSEVEPAEKVTASAVVTNTGGSKGKYTVVLKINGVEEARKEVTLDAGASQKVSFSIAKSIAETYDVNINGLAGSFIVKEAVVTPLLEPSEEPLPTQPVKVINWWLIGAIIAAIIVTGIVSWRLVIRVRA